MVLEILAAALGVSLRNVQPSSTSQYVIPWATFSNIIKEKKLIARQVARDSVQCFPQVGGTQPNFVQEGSAP